MESINCYINEIEGYTVIVKLALYDGYFRLSDLEFTRQFDVYLKLPIDPNFVFVLVVQLLSAP